MINRRYHHSELISAIIRSHETTAHRHVKNAQSNGQPTALVTFYEDSVQTLRLPL
jgi:hypothetical protein